MEKKYIRLNPDGSSEYVVEHSEPKQIAESLIQRFGKDVVRVVKRVFPTPNGVAHMIITGTECYAVSRLPRINLLSHYDTLEDKTLVPVFIKDDAPNAANYPVMPLVWECPKDMVLLFVARIYNHDNVNEKMMTHKDQSCFLIAYNQQKQAWLLPLPNLYEDTAICMGQFDGISTNAARSFGVALEQFDKSSWNSDLIEKSRIEASKLMFRFKADKTETTCIPFTGDWTQLCQKKATPITALIAQLL